MMERNARTPGFVAHYRPAPAWVWLLMVVLLGAGAAVAAIYLVIIR